MNEQNNNSKPWEQNFLQSFGMETKKNVPMEDATQGGTQLPPWEDSKKFWNNFTFTPPKQSPQKQENPSSFDAIWGKLIQQESRGKHLDASGQLTKSPVGALGITQIMPATGKDPGYGVAPLKDHSEAEYLRVGKGLLKAYTRELGGDMRKGLAAYNAGIGTVKKAITKYGDEWETKLPQETRKYLTNILGGSSANAAQPNYGSRPDGTQKGNGFLGPIKAKDGSTMTEYSVGVNIGGKEMDIPTFVPTLTKSELDSMLAGNKPSDAIVQKAVDHAKMRMKEGKSPFAQQGEKYQKVK